MRSNYRFKRHRRYAPQAQAVQSAVWLIGLGILFLTGWWWPGILIVIGASMVVGALAQESAPARAEQPAEPPAAPPPSPFDAAKSEAVVLRAEPAATKPVRLPDLCPYCGAPPRSLPIRDPDNLYACPYCGTSLQSLSE